MTTILIILLILILLGWGHSANWGYGPTGVIGLVLVVLLILYLLGHIK